MKCCFVLLTLFTCVNLKVNAYGFGRCPTIPSQPAFNTDEFLGLWYEIKRSNSLAEKNTKCNTINFAIDKDGTLFSHNHAISTTTGMEKSTVSQAKQNQQNKAQFGFIINPLAPKIPYNVVKSDYKTYALIYSCFNFLFFKKENYWMYSRTPKLSDASLHIMELALTNNSVDLSRIVTTDQTDCPEYKGPEPARLLETPLESFNEINSEKSFFETDLQLMLEAIKKEEEV